MCNLISRTGSSRCASFVASAGMLKRRSMGEVVTKQNAWIIVCLALAMPCAATAENAAACTPGAAAVSRVKDLPPDVQAYFARRGAIADPGEQFNSSDVIADEKVPQQRLISAVSGDDCISVTVERGGRGYSVGTFIFQRIDGHWRALPPEPKRRGRGADPEAALPASDAAR